MKRVLFISSRPIYPILGGDQIRTSQQLELLAEKCSVDVVYITPNYKEDNVENFVANAKTLRRFRVSKIYHYIHTLKFLFNSLPLQVNYYYLWKVAKFIKSIYRDYDMIFCNNIRTAQYAMNLDCPVKCLDFVDAISMNYDKAKNQAKGIKRLIYSIDYKRCRKYEKTCLERFSSCAVISEIDNKYITEWGK